MRTTKETGASMRGGTDRAGTPAAVAAITAIAHWPCNDASGKGTDTLIDGCKAYASPVASHVQVPPREYSPPKASASAENDGEVMETEGWHMVIFQGAAELAACERAKPV
jgi:hypothetical protein